jgi:hypothetical protein
LVSRGRRDGGLTPGERSKSASRALAVALALLSAHTALAQDASSVSSSSVAAKTDDAKAFFECPGCLRKVPADAERCPECGVSFKKLEYECPRCKATVAYDATQCPSCGLKFDAPTPDAHEKRSATERSMPATRDFLKNPETPPGDELEVHGQSITLFRGGRERSRTSEETVDRYVEDLSVNVLHIGVKGLSFHSSALAMYTDAPRDLQTYGEPFQFLLKEGYLRYETDDEKTQVQAGRQLVASGVTREFLDGLFIHQMFGDRLGLEGWGGHPVSTEKSDATGDGELGGRIFFRGVPKLLTRLLRDLTIGVSAQEERWGWHTVKRQVGVDLSFSPSWSYDLSGHAYFDLVTEALYDARATFVARPIALIQLTADYRYLVPSSFLPKDSIFVVFADDKRHEFELDLDFWPSERLKVHGFAELYYIPERAFNTTVTDTLIEPKDNMPYRLGAGISYKHGSLLRGEFGVEGSLIVKGGLERYQGATVYGSSVVVGRVYEMLNYEVAAKHMLRASLDGQVEAYDVKIYLKRNEAFTVTGTLGYTYDAKYGLTIGGDWRRTPDFDNTVDFFARAEVDF